MTIAEILSPECVMCKADAVSKKGALEQLSMLISDTGTSLDYTEIFDCLNARERLGSTGLGHGVAIPHGRLDTITHPTAAFLRLKQGVDFDAIDQQPVDLLFALLVPEESTDEHLKILSSLAEMFSEEAFLRRLRAASTADRLFELLARKK